MALVDKAAALIDSKGKAAFAEFRNAGSEWNYGDTYLFITTSMGRALFHGSLPELEGTNVLGLKDSNGKLFVVEMSLRRAQVQGIGMGRLHVAETRVQTQPSEKWSYVKAVTIDGTPALVGAGFYPS